MDRCDPPFGINDDEIAARTENVLSCRVYRSEGLDRRIHHQCLFPTANEINLAITPANVRNLLTGKTT